MHEPFRPIKTDHLAETVPKAMPMSLSQIIQFVPGNIHAAGGHFVKQWLPQMRTSLFDQGDIRELTPPEPITEGGHEFEPTSPAANNDDAMKATARNTCWALMVRARHFLRSSVRPPSI
jgi:hypothetical protein